MQKVEKVMVSLTEDEIEVSTESVHAPVDKSRNKRRECAAASVWNFWSGWPDGLAVFVLRTKDVFMKWAFAKSAKLY